jgi:hypothetical protein
MAKAFRVPSGRIKLFAAILLHQKGAQATHKSIVLALISKGYLLSIPTTQRQLTNDSLTQRNSN